MRYSMIDVECEIIELKSLTRGRKEASSDAIIWRIEQMLRDVSIGTKTRNRRIISGISEIEEVIKTAANSKNKKNLEIIIREKKEEVQIFESLENKLDSQPILKQLIFRYYIKSMENNITNVFYFTNFRN